MWRKSAGRASGANDPKMIAMRSAKEPGVVPMLRLTKPRTVARESRSPGLGNHGGSSTSKEEPVPRFH